MQVQRLVLVVTLSLLFAAGVVWRGTPGEAERAARTAPPPAEGARVSATARPDGPRVRVAGIVVNGPTHTGADPAASDSFDVELAFFGTFERTRLALEVERPGGGIFEVDGAGSSVSRFRDDLGTDLALERSSWGPFELGARVSEDGRHAVVVVASKELPARGASRLEAAGEIALLVSEERETVTSEDIALAAGARADLGGLAVEVVEFGPSDWDDGWALELGGSGDASAVVRWALVLPDGSETELRESMTMSGGGAWRRTLELEVDPPERARLRVERWRDVERVVVPFAVDASLGLGD